MEILNKLCCSAGIDSPDTNGAIATMLKQHASFDISICENLEHLSIYRPHLYVTLLSILFTVCKYLFYRNPSSKDYNMVGHEAPSSILNDIWENETFIPSSESSYSFLYGGIGDARHVLASLIHLDNCCEQLPATKLVHFTLVDHKASHIARSLVTFYLLHRLSTFPREEHRSNLDAVEVRVIGKGGVTFYFLFRYLHFYTTYTLALSCRHTYMPNSYLLSNN